LSHPSFDAEQGAQDVRCLSWATPNTAVSRALSI
jgi:hypothetical protein